MPNFILTKSFILSVTFILLGHSAFATRDLLISNVSTNSILRFDGASGAAKGAFIQSSVGGLTSPQQMAIGPDGNLYVADSLANTVKRYNLLDGSFIDDFTPVGDLLSPIALKFFDDGVNGMKLYVLGGSTQRRISRYNLESGYKETNILSTTSTVIGTARDFLFMTGSNDVLVIGSNNKGVRFQLSTGSIISTFINPSGTTTILNSPRNILYGPDGNIWISSSTGNKITRFNPSTGAKIDDIISGPPLSNGPFQMQIEGTTLYVANGSANNVIKYELVPSASSLAKIQSQLDTNTKSLSKKNLTKRQQQRLLTERQQLKVSALAASLTITPSAGQVFVDAGSQGLSNAQFMLFVDINDPPVANAGADSTVAGGEAFNLDATLSYDPEGVPLSVQWTQLSGPTPSASPTPSPSPTAAAAGSGSGSTPVVTLVSPYMPALMVFRLDVFDGVKTAFDTVTVSIGGFIDNDNDGMPDRWELANGLNTSLNDAASDLDADGQRNYNEFMAGTNPALNSDSLRVLQYSVVPGGFSIRFTSVVGRHYEIQSSENLVNWSTVPGLEDVLAAESDFETVVIDTRPMVSKRFYRIGVKPIGF